MADTATATTSETKRPAFGGHLRGTEGIRGPLCVLIVWYHAYLYTSPDGPPSVGFLYTGFVTRIQLGLSVFFILSAFLLYRPFVQSVLRGTPRPSFPAYLKNRALRIMPVYWLVLFAAAILGITVVNIPSHEIGVHVPTLVANMFLVHGLHPSGIQTGVPPAWSLAVEWVFYLALPLMVLFALSIGGRAATRQRRILALLAPAAALFVIGIIGKEISRRTIVPEDPFGVHQTWHAVAERGFTNWSDLFGLGMALAVLRVQFEDGRLRLWRHWRKAALLFWAVGSVGLVALQHRDHIDYPMYNLLVGFPLAAFVAAVVLWRGEVNNDLLMRVLEWRPFVKLGEISLSVYLIHYPVIMWVVVKTDWMQSGYLGLAFNCAVITAITLALSLLTFRYVEQPAIKRKFRGKVEGPPPPLDRSSREPAAEPARA